MCINANSITHPVDVFVAVCEGVGVSVGIGYWVLGIGYWVGWRTLPGAIRNVECTADTMNIFTGYSPVTTSVPSV